MEAGALRDVQAIFGLHASPLLTVGTVGISEGAVTAAVDRFVFRFIGKGTHAAHPQRGIDPIPLAAGFIQAVQTVVARNLHPFSAGLVSVTHVAAGNTWNVIPEEALVEGTTRSMDGEERTLIRKRVCALAEGLAQAHGAEVVTDWYEGPPATANDVFGHRFPSGWQRRVICRLCLLRNPWAVRTLPSIRRTCRAVSCWLERDCPLPSTIRAFA